MSHLTAWRLVGIWCVIAALLCGSTDTAPGAAPDDENSLEPDPKTVPTHRQIGVIAIGTEGNPKITTFCIDRDDRIIVACGGKPRKASDTEDGKKANTTPVANELNVFSLQGELLNSIPLDFEPQAVNVDDDGNVYVAGRGHIRKFDNNWHELAKAERPGIPSVAEYSKLENERVRKRHEKSRKSWLGQIDTLEKEIAERVKNDPENVGASTDQRRLALLRKNLKRAEDGIARVNSSTGTSTTNKLNFTGIAASGGNVYVACPALQGYGYEAFRLNSDLEDPERIIGSLRGCCGQMDIQSNEGDVFAAENARFRVVRFDPSGKELKSFGEKARNSIQGFESCCNPMNIRFGPGGEIYTAESNVGNIKRFSREGEFLGLVGRANLIPGCKRVAIDVSENGDHVYMLDITRSQIYILGRKTEVWGDQQDRPART